MGLENLQDIEGHVLPIPRDSNFAEIADLVDDELEVDNDKQPVPRNDITMDNNYVECVENCERYNSRELLIFCYVCNKRFHGLCLGFVDVTDVPKCFCCDPCIYSFDVDLSSDIIQKLKQKYGITESPIIVINEKKKMTVPDNIDEIEVYLK